MIPEDEWRETVLRLYPIFKEEVYRRHDQIMRWTAIGAGSLVAILSMVLLVPAAHSLSTPPRLLLACATPLLAITSNEWTRDRSLLHYIAVLTLLTGIVLVAILQPSL